MSFQLFILWIALNVVPAHVTSFIFTSPDKQPVEYAKEADGGWNAVTPDKRAGPTVYFTETELTIVPSEGKKMSIPAADAMGLKEKVAWQTVESLPFGQAVLKVHRQPDGFDLVFDSPEQPAADPKKQTYTVRWKEDAR